MKAFLILSFSTLFFNLTTLSQINFNTIGSSYSQNFNGISITGSHGASQTWTNNSSLSGWYLQQNTNNTTAVILELSPTSGTPINTGGHYVVKNGTDISIGTRASGSYTNSMLGVRFKNNTASIIKSLKVEYYGEQHSIAENQTNVNNLTFHFQKVNSPSTITSLSSGSWTALTGLNFTQIFTSSQSSGLGGTACAGNSAQCLALDGNNSANRSYKTLNFDVTLNPGDEIMLRWLDVDNSANDHHFQIDDVVVTPYDQITSVVLPIDLISFDVNCEENNLNFTWTTASERDNESFEIEETEDGKQFNVIHKQNAAGNSTQINHYSAKIDNSKSNQLTYYRLKQIDFDGNFTFSNLISSSCEQKDDIQIFPNPTNGTITIKGYQKNSNIRITNQIGQELTLLDAKNSETKIDLSFFNEGIYYVTFYSNEKLEIKKLIVKK